MKITLMDNGPDRPPTVTGGDPPKKKQYDPAPVDPANKELIDWYTRNTSAWDRDAEPGETLHTPGWNTSTRGPVLQGEPEGVTGGTGRPPIPGDLTQTNMQSRRAMIPIADAMHVMNALEDRLDEFMQGVDLDKVDPQSPTGQRYLKLKNEVDNARKEYRSLRDKFNYEAGTADLGKLRNSIINRLRRDGYDERLIPQRADQLVEEYQRKFMGYVGE